MNNGVNENQQLTIEPIAEQPAIAAAAPQPVIQPETKPEIQPEIKPEIQPEAAPQPTIQPETKPEGSLGSNVKIAPAQPMYDANGKVVEQTPAEEKKPIVTQPTPTPPGEPPQIQVRQESEQAPAEEQKEEKSEKKQRNLRPLFLIIILVLVGVIVYQYLDKQQTLKQAQYNNIVTSTDGKEIELDLNSTIVQDLYDKVKTTVKEDIANPNFDDEMKRYLAFRQLSANDLYESNCNLFDQTGMFFYACNEQSDKPLAFKEESLQREIKTLFGENTNLVNANIQLGRHCLGGYEYIEARGEYVQGKCTKHSASTTTAKKTLIKATKKDNEIKLEEETRYVAADNSEMPGNLKSGIYTYTFRLDTNLNYAYVSKDYRTKY